MNWTLDSQIYKHNRIIVKQKRQLETSLGHRFVPTKPGYENLLIGIST
jgi:hypothetical protein